MLHPLAARLVDHVELATPMDAAGYIAAALLWLVGVMLVVYHKLHASR